MLEKRFCVAETKSYTNYTILPVFALESMFRTRVELPVDESDITQLVEKIKIGFPVMVVPRNLKEIENKKILELPDTSNKDAGEEKKRF